MKGRDLDEVSITPFMDPKQEAATIIGIVNARGP